MAAGQHLVGKKLFNLDFGMTLPEVKRAPLLSILTHTDFEEHGFIPSIFESGA
jgi:hypothetical protein